MACNAKVRMCLLACGCAAAGLFAGCGKEEHAPLPAAQVSTTAPAPVFEGAWAYAPVGVIDSGMAGAHGLALDESGQIYVAGDGGVRVLRGDGTLVREWNTGSPATCIALDEEHVFLGGRTRIEVFTRDGAFVRAWGEEGDAPWQLRHVTSLAVRGAEVFVADAGNRRVHRFDLAGDYIGAIGARDPTTGAVGLVVPSPHLDLFVDAEGVLHVANPGRGRVERYSADGALLGAWGEPGARPEQFWGCCNPTNIAHLPGGEIAASEKLRVCVKVYGKEGELLALIGPEHFTPRAAGLDIAVDARGRLLVLDPGDGKIKVFERTR